MAKTDHSDGSTRTRGRGRDDAVDHAGRRPDSLDDIRETYADQADTVARMRWLDRLLLGRYRRRLFGQATGRVLDVACGIGTNADYVPETTEYVGIDVSPEMLREAEARSPRLVRGETLFEMDAQALAFPDDSFETVISSLSTCTFPDPVAALDEMNRVCEPNGQVLLLEHGRSSVELLGRFQDWRADAHYEKHNCRWNQEPLELVSRSELSVTTSATGMLGVITGIRAEPG
ncbi:class I SAM-dependent methyltransferase [Halosimplex salinum]|uniref:class I SAM-dependent methyltransferase n=1 Tax=Halosimplex salinum TaxID=1710538 RepID=UPI000F470518|nr:class I SAM-dependent methyltransferase [Halosimplex salinum]